MASDLIIVPATIKFRMWAHIQNTLHDPLRHSIRFYPSHTGFLDFVVLFSYFNVGSAHRACDFRWFGAWATLQWAIYVTCRNAWSPQALALEDRGHYQNNKHGHSLSGHWAVQYAYTWTSMHHPTLYAHTRDSAHRTTTFILGIWRWYHSVWNN